MKQLLYAKSFIHSLNFFSLIFRSFSIKVLAVTSVLVAALSSVTLVRSEAAALEHDNINKDTSALRKEANKRSKENKQLFDLIKPVTTVLDRNSIASNVYKIALNVSNPVLLSSRARFISTVPSTQTLTPSASNLPPMARTFNWGIAGYDPVTGPQSVQTNPTWKNTIGRLFLADGVINSKQGYRNCSWFE
ncbi:hypothetical protein ABID23_001083 [Bartonella silvatica]|uniref:Uncharacterized protein n=1 Tax=Bartonella silvatica TaxID=357760 RepID=A0ABV2HHF5_9HYPH